MSDDFDIDDVHRLVDEAMGGALVERAPQSRSITNRVPFGIYDTDIIEQLHGLLVKLPIHQGDVQMVLDELRNKLTKDLDLGSLRDLHSLTLNCRRCPELKDATLPFGNLVDPDIVFILEYPANDWPPELVTILEQVGIDQARAMVTFAARCKTQIKRAYTEEEFKNCSTYLFSELQLLAPKLIVPVGSITSHIFLDPLKISEDHGIIFWVGPWAIMPVFALGYLTRNDGADKEYRVDLTKAKTFLYG